MIKYFPKALPVPTITMSRKIYIERIPWLKVDREKRRLAFDPAGTETELVEFYNHFLSEDFDYFEISPNLDPGLYRLAEIYTQNPWAELKYIHITFPGLFTWGLLLKDANGYPALYDQNLKDIIIKGLSAKVRWRENKVRELFPNVNVIVTAGDASLSVFASAGGTGTWDTVKRDYNEILSLVQGIKGVHCCANFDWSLLMQTDVQIINLDAYQFGMTMSLYPEALNAYLRRGGTIAWGLVPTIPSEFALETPKSLIERFENIIKAVAASGIDKQRLIEASWITPACETATMPVDLAEKVYAVTHEISKRLRDEYFGQSV